MIYSQNHRDYSHSADVTSTSILNLCDVPRGVKERTRIYFWVCVIQTGKESKKIKPIVWYQSCLVKFNPFDCVLFRKMNLLQSMQIDFTIRWWPSHPLASHGNSFLHLIS